MTPGAMIGGMPYGGFERSLERKSKQPFKFDLRVSRRKARPLPPPKHHPAASPR